jgi:hypothetical protein
MHKKGWSPYRERVRSPLGNVRDGRDGRLGEAIGRGFTKTLNLLRWALQL